MSIPVPTVLFVDDEPSVLAGIQLTLRHRGFRLLSAGTAAEALRYLAEERIAVVVSDETMPGMSGTTLLSDVRRRYPSTVRMVLSGSTDPRAISRAVNEAALFRYLLKPCTPSDLILAVDQALEAHLVQQGHAPAPRAVLDIDDVLTELQVQVQPIFSLDRGDVFAHECLLRLPERFHASAMDVLDVAEHEDRLWGVERAIRRAVAARIPERPSESLVFVNVHPKSLLDPELFDRRDPLASYAAAVVLEITERSALTDVPDLPDRVAALRRLGYRVAIDDLGSGYSGLTSFASLMPDFVKFDRELIQGIHEASAKRKLVQSFVTVCAGLGVQTIAEGVEDERDLAAIRLMGCGYVQGFLLARPAPAFFAPAYPGWRAARGTLAPVMASDVVGGWQS